MDKGSFPFENPDLVLQKRLVKTPGRQLDVEVVVVQRNDDPDIHSPRGRHPQRHQKRRVRNKIRTDDPDTLLRSRHRRIEHLFASLAALAPAGGHQTHRIGSCSPDRRKMDRFGKVLRLFIRRIHPVAQEDQFQFADDGAFDAAVQVVNRAVPMPARRHVLRADVDPPEKGHAAVHHQKFPVIAQLEAPAREAVHQGERTDAEGRNSTTEVLEHVVEGGEKAPEAVVKNFDLHAGGGFVFQSLEDVVSDFVVGDDEALEVDEAPRIVDRPEHLRIGGGAVAEKFHAVASDGPGVGQDPVEHLRRQTSPRPDQRFELGKIAALAFVALNLQQKIIRRRRDPSADHGLARPPGQKIENHSEDRECGNHGEPQKGPLRFISLIPQNVNRADGDRQNDDPDPDCINHHHEFVDTHVTPPEGRGDGRNSSGGAEDDSRFPTPVRRWNPLFPGCTSWPVRPSPAVSPS